MRPRWKVLWREWGQPLAFGLLVTQFGATAVGVDGQSMVPGLRHGEWLAVPKLEGWAHRAGLGGYQRGDIVVFKPPREAGYEWKRDWRGLRLPWSYRPYLVKRVVALPGDRVAMRGGRLFVNGAAVPEAGVGAYWTAGCRDTASDLANSVSASARQIGLEEIVVPAGSYFVMGDNRSPGGSLDSRAFGPVKLGDMAGRAVASLWPLMARPPGPSCAQPMPESSALRWNVRWLGGRDVQVR